MSRTWILVAVLAVGLAVGWYVMREGDDATAANEPATATERASRAGDRPVLPSNSVGVRTPYWKRDEVRAATTGAPNLEAPSERVPETVRERVSDAMHAQRHGRSSATVTQDEVDKTVARVEAKEGVTVSKERRAQIEKTLLARKGGKQESRVPGANQMRDIRDKAVCTAPDAQQKYAAMSDADKLRMRQRCGKFGFVPAS